MYTFHQASHTSQIVPRYKRIRIGPPLNEHACIYIYLYIYIHIYMYICACVFVYVGVINYTYIYTYFHIYTCTYLSAYIYIFMYTYTHVCMYIKFNYHAGSILPLTHTHNLYNCKHTPSHVRTHVI